MKKIYSPSAWTLLGISLWISPPETNGAQKEYKRPSVVFVFADQLRACDLGYNGNKDVITPNIDGLSRQSVNIKYAFSGCPVCTPYRASLLTGQYPLTNGAFLNDVQINPDAESLGKVFKCNGYQTGYVGKWHVDGMGRSSFIPKERRQGFDYWKVLECTHDYLKSTYWDNNDQYCQWKGYDAFAQTRDVCQYITQHAKDKDPFIMVLSFGAPHNPYNQIEQKYIDLFKDKKLTLRENIPDSFKEKAIRDLIGYYAHITALDLCVEQLGLAIKKAGIEDNTIFVFTSDHGEMLFSHSQIRKQKPWDESIHVPFLLKYPARFGTLAKTTNAMLNTPDIMPTLLGLCNLPIPASVEGKDLSGIISGDQKDKTEAVLLTCPHPFGEFAKNKGGAEYRGIRTRRYTYACRLNNEPWIFYDNQNDPFQMNNLINHPGYSRLQADLEKLLQKLLKENNDQFLPGMEYVKKWGYKVDKTGTVNYNTNDFRGNQIVEPPIPVPDEN